jgi:hypothetical protein
MADTSYQTLAYAVAYVTFVIGLSTVFLRVYCRGFMLKAWGMDDNIALFVAVSWSTQEQANIPHTGTTGSELWSAGNSTSVSPCRMRTVSTKFKRAYPTQSDEERKGI